MTEKEMWKAYIKEHSCYEGEDYEVWCYGSEAPDLLAELTVSGIKTATASAFPCYEYEKCELPKAGEHSIILNQDGLAMCIIKTTLVTVIPFRQVSAEHAYKEGEGDRSLEYWREAHQGLFTEELTEINERFSEDMLVVCEEFQVVFGGV